MFAKTAARIVFALASLSGCAPRQAALPPSAASPLLGHTAPVVKRRALTGPALEAQDTAGHVVVIKFFADYCASCKFTLPEAEDLAEQLDDVVFIGVAEDEYETAVQQLVTRYGLSFTVIHDRGQVLAGRFRVAEIPATFVIDGANVVRWVGGPGQRPGDLRKAIRAVRRGAN